MALDVSTSAVLGRVAEELCCPICLDVAQLPCNFTCFKLCRGNAGGLGGGGCLRNLVCAHCANTALQLDRAPGCRFPDAAPPGSTTCLICRDTRVDARTLTPASAYALNHNVMAIADALGMQAECRPCGEEFESQAALLQHYLRRCPAAVVRCRFRGCHVWLARAAVAQHEERCPVGRSPCSQCGGWVDKSELLRHMVTSCRQRVVGCMLCSHTARLPDMLEHLKLHQQQLHQQVRRQGAQGLQGAQAPQRSQGLQGAQGQRQGREGLGGVQGQAMGGAVPTGAAGAGDHVPQRSSDPGIALGQWLAVHEQGWRQMRLAGEQQGEQQQQQHTASPLREGTSAPSVMASPIASTSSFAASPASGNSVSASSGTTTATSSPAPPQASPITNGGPHRQQDQQGPEQQIGYPARQESSQGTESRQQVLDRLMRLAEQVQQQQRQRQQEQQQPGQLYPHQHPQHQQQHQQQHQGPAQPMLPQALVTVSAAEPAQSSSTRPHRHRHTYDGQQHEPLQQPLDTVQQGQGHHRQQPGRAQGPTGGGLMALATMAVARVTNFRGRARGDRATPNGGTAHGRTHRSATDDGQGLGLAGVGLPAAWGSGPEAAAAQPSHGRPTVPPSLAGSLDERTVPATVGISSVQLQAPAPVWAGDVGAGQAQQEQLQQQQHRSASWAAATEVRMANGTWARSVVPPAGPQGQPVEGPAANLAAWAGSEGPPPPYGAVPASSSTASSAARSREDSDASTAATASRLAATAVAQADAVPTNGGWSATAAASAGSYGAAATPPPPPAAGAASGPSAEQARLTAAAAHILRTSAAAHGLARAGRQGSGVSLSPRAARRGPHSPFRTTTQLTSAANAAAAATPAGAAAPPADSRTGPGASALHMASGAQAAPVAAGGPAAAGDASGAPYVGATASERRENQYVGAEVPIRRSFSDTELVNNVLEDLVRASAAVEDRGHARASASGNV